jgi:hypothetical protein
MPTLKFSQCIDLSMFIKIRWTRSRDPNRLPGSFDPAAFAAFTAFEINRPPKQTSRPSLLAGAA